MIVGHTRILARLEEEAREGRLHHAQLFVGPAQVGKATMAVHLATLLQGVAEQPVLKKQLMEGLDADTILLLDSGESLPIEAIRKVLERVHQGHARPHLIVVVENLGRMKPEAMNALLKTLEEPLPGVLFFLTAHEEDSVLATIRSRAHVTAFSTVASDDLRALIGTHVQAEKLLLYSMGRPGRLLRLMNDPAYFDVHEAMLTDVLRFTENPQTSAVFGLTRRYEDDPHLLEFLDLLLGRLHHYLHTRDLPQLLRGADLSSLLEAVEEVKVGLKGNVNTRLLLENLLLRFVA